MHGCHFTSLVEALNAPLFLCFLFSVLNLCAFFSLYSVLIFSIFGFNLMVGPLNQHCCKSVTHGNCHKNERVFVTI